MKIPGKGLPKEETLQILQNYKGQDLDWQSGQVLGLIYDAGQKVHDVSHDTYTMYLTENALDLQDELKKLSLEYDDETFFKLAEMAGVSIMIIIIGT